MTRLDYDPSSQLIALDTKRYKRVITGDLLIQERAWGCHDVTWVNGTPNAFRKMVIFSTSPSEGVLSNCCGKLRGVAVGDRVVLGCC